MNHLLSALVGWLLQDATPDYGSMGVEDAQEQKEAAVACKYAEIDDAPAERHHQIYE